ncbi:MAG: TA system antitoxin ParD family protein [Myxococcota bacterium]
MGLPLRIDDELVLRARLEAESTDRSVTGQLEHWVKLGLALEDILGHRQAIELKRRGASVPLAEALAKAGTTHGQELTLRHLESTRQLRYGVDPEHPGMLVRVAPDGKRTRGRFVNRVFVPMEPEPG